MRGCCRQILRHFNVNFQHHLPPPKPLFKVRIRLTCGRVNTAMVGPYTSGLSSTGECQPGRNEFITRLPTCSHNYIRGVIVMEQIDVCKPVF